MKELERLNAQNKILRDLLDAFIKATKPTSENMEFSATKMLHVRQQSIAMLKRIDDFSIKRIAVLTT